MTPARRMAASTLASVLALVPLATTGGCAASTASGTYTVAFQSTAQAVAVESVRVTIFDASASPELCIDLLVKAASSQTLPPSLVDTASTTPCDLARGAATINVPLKTVAVLAVAQSKGVTIARGCARQTLSEANPNVVVELAYVESAGVAPPTTTCATLAEHCSGGC